MKTNSELLNSILTHVSKAAKDCLKLFLTPSTPLLPGDKIWTQTSPNRWLCGRVERVTANHVELGSASWIDHTGDFWGDALLKGATVKGWSSEFQGKVILSVRGMHEVLFMGPDAVLPSGSIRPKKDPPTQVKK